jgi:hypothetical protein
LVHFLCFGIVYLQSFLSFVEFVPVLWFVLIGVACKFYPSSAICVWMWLHLVLIIWHDVFTSFPMHFVACIPVQFCFFPLLIFPCNLTLTRVSWWFLPALCFINLTITLQTQVLFALLLGLPSTLSTALLDAHWVIHNRFLLNNHCATNTISDPTCTAEIFTT